MEGKNRGEIDMERVRLQAVKREGYTKLYSRKLSCRIVSLTAANTKRMFSVSVKK
jgi:hypothetical protein